MKLLFDFGGVIVDLRKDAAIAAFENLGLDIRPFLGTFRQSGIFSALENGDISLDRFCHEVRKLAGRPELENTEIIAAWEAFLVGIPAERLQLLLNIRRHYPTYVLSNTNVVHWEQGKRDFFSWQGHRLEDFFDGCFLSFEMHLQKPDPDIFKAVVGGMDCAAEEILFFDDSEANCEAARQCGLQARLAPAGGSWTKFFDADGRLTND